MGTKNDLNKMAWPAQKAGLGDKLDAIITLLNEMKADYNAHIADAAVHTQADATNVVTSPDVPTLD